MEFFIRGDHQCGENPGVKVCPGAGVIDNPFVFPAVVFFVDRADEACYVPGMPLFSEEEYLKTIESSGLKLIQRLDETEFRMGAFICTQ